MYFDYAQHKQKGSASLVALLVVLVILVIGAFFVLGAKAKLPVSTKPALPPTQYLASPTPNPYQDWASYKNANYSLSYPKDWTAEGTSSAKLGNYVLLKNASSNVWLRITDKKQMFEFGAVSAWKTSDTTVNIGGKDYNTHESIVNNRAVFVDLSFNQGKEIQVTFGTGYPATTYAITPSLDEYNKSKQIILKILKSLKITSV